MEIDVNKCEYYNNGKCERYEDHIEADYNDYTVKCICDHENCFGGYDICDYMQLQQLKEHCKQVDETNKILYQEKCDLIKQNEELKKRVDYCFEENSPNYDRFCDICVAKDTCNGNCCYNQIKEILGYEI